jgi:hypothetical protein
MAVEIVDPIDSRGDVARAHCVQKVIGAGVIPFVPLIELRRCVGSDLWVLNTLDDHFLAGLDGDRLPVGGSDGGPAASTGDERGALAQNIHAVIARMLYGEYRVRRVYLHRPPRLDRAQVERGVALGQLKLKKIMLMVLKPKLSVCAAAHESTGSDLYLQVPLRPGI